MSANELLPKVGGLLEIISFPETPEERDAAENEIRDGITRLIAVIDRVEGVADWIRDNHGDYISREIEDRIRAALDNR